MGMGVAGMTINSDYGSFSHSLLSTSESIKKSDTHHNQSECLDLFQHVSLREIPNVNAYSNAPGISVTETLTNSWCTVLKKTDNIENPWFHDL